ncbi:cysteine desulfurase family protein [Blastococcus sp. SYSU DS0541]
MADLIYLDAAASAPVAPEALAATVEVLQQIGNPGAAHAAGRAAAARVESARGAVAELLNVGPAGVVFVGSATEANNLVLRGVTAAPGRREIVTTTAEHPSVLATLADVGGERGAIHLVSVGRTGEVDLERLDGVLSAATMLISIHAANNETGVIQPLEQVIERARAVGAIVHADASQLMAWGPSSLLDECDLITVSSHKMHGPQGAAALIVRPSARDRLRPQVTGGGQERGLRSGTVNVAAVAGFGAAATLALSSGAKAAATVRDQRVRLLAGLRRAIPDLTEHGAGAARRLPGILNVALGTSWPDSVESEALLARLPALAASTGSACRAGAPEPSPVLLAMGSSEWEAARSIRLSLSRYTTDADIHAAVAEIRRGYTELVQLLDPCDSEERH